MNMAKAHLLFGSCLEWLMLFLISKQKSDHQNLIILVRQAKKFERNLYELL